MSADGTETTGRAGTMKGRPLVEALGDESQSTYEQYMEMFVGERSAAALLRYEALTGLLGPMPGALGYFLRSKLYPKMLRRYGRGTVFGRSVTLRSPNRISLGRRVLVDDYAVLDAKGRSSSIVLADKILVGRNTILSCNDARITVGSFVSVGPFCFFASKSHIDVGSNVSIGSGTHMLAGTHAVDDVDTPIIMQERISQGITIEDDVWIGSGAKILDGVTVGKGSIVGAGSVVNKDVAPYTVVLGNPARVLQKRKESPGA